MKNYRDMYAHPEWQSSSLELKPLPYSPVDTLESQNFYCQNFSLSEKFFLFLESLS